MKWRTITNIFLKVFPPSFAIAVPVDYAGATMAGGLGLQQVGYNLNPQNSIGEIAVVEGKGEVGFGARGSERYVQVHDNTRIEEINVVRFLSRPGKPNERFLKGRAVEVVEGV